MRLVLDDLGGPHIDWADPELRLTEAQRAAMVTDRELVLTAGAGAGKTHTLALRYVALLLERVRAGDPDVESVLVLTFTERAAEEMAERCTARLADLCRAARALAPELDDHDPAGIAGRRLVADLEGLLDRIDRARIGTFHGFCSSILREHPAEARTPPGARVLDPAESSALIAQVLDDSLQRLIEADPDALALLLDAFGSRRQLLEAGHTALARRGVLQQVLAAHADGSLGLHEALASAPVSAADAHTFATATGPSAVRAIERLTAPSGGGPFVERRLRPALDTITEPLAPPDDQASVLGCYSRYRQVLELLLTDQGTLRTLTHHTVLGPRSAWPDTRRYSLAKQALTVLQERLGDWPERARLARMLPTPADEALYAALTPFSRWVRDTATLLRATLDDKRSLTFDAMQLRAVQAVLDHPELRQHLRERFRYLMVDEFQDTDALQWSLVRALARADPAVPEDRVFLVGDVKQAIYGFRGGDVTMFRTATAELGVAPLRLPDNFRSQPALIRWFNALFPHVLGPPGPDREPWEAPYEPLGAGRPDEAGQVTLVQGSTEADGEHWEPRVVARWLAEAALDDGSPYWDRQRHPTPPIVILLRVRTRLDAWQHALRAEGVPFVVGQGVGFWRRPEVLDLVNAVSALAHADERSWVGLLRSPLVGLTDRQLQDLRDGRLGPRGLLGFGTDDLPEHVDRRLHQARGRVARWLELRRVRPVADLVRVLIADNRPALHASDPSGQAEANAHRLASLASAFDGRGPEGLVEAADHLLAQVEAGTREPEATLVPTRARVVILTVHACKGLEFPTVVVPELHRRPRPTVEPLVVRRGGPAGSWRMATRVMDPTASIQTRVRPGLLASLEQLRTHEEDAEYRRLLYVAVTRARDQLVLVTETPRPADPGARRTWAQHITEALPRATTTVAASQWVSSEPRTERPAATPPPPGADDRRRVAPIAAATALELPASSLDLFAACPARWYRRVVLGVPEEAARVAERALQLAAARGQVLHQVLEDELEDDDRTIADRWTARSLLDGATPDEHDLGLLELRRHLLVTQQVAHVRRVLAAPGWAEVPVRRSHAGVTVRGRIDRLWLDDDGWVVLDWKSERVAGDPGEVAARHARQLLAYAWAADPILRSQGQPGVLRAEVVFTAIGRVVSAGDLDEESTRQTELLLEQVASVSAQPWAEVRDAAVSGRPARPCDRCGFRGRGCPGRSVPSTPPQLDLL